MAKANQTGVHLLGNDNEKTKDGEIAMEHWSDETNTLG